MSDPPPASVLITAHDEARSIGATLRSVATAASPRTEVVLVDDRSTDGTAQAARAAGLENLRLVRIEEYRPGPLTARQVALKRGFDQVRGEVLFLTDADGRVSPNWIEQGLSVLREERVDALASPVAFSPRGSVIADLQSVDSIFYLSVCAWLHGAKLPAGLLFGNLAVRRSAIEAAGGLVGAGFSLTEDLAFARALHRIGARIRFAPRATVEVAACRSWRELVTRAKRTSRGGFSALALVLGLWMGLLAALAVGALIAPSALAGWLAFRYMTGVLFTGMGIGRAGAWHLLPHALWYEPAALAIGLSVLTRPGRGRGIRWGDVLYDRR